MSKTHGFEGLVGTEIGSVALGPDGTTVFLHGTDGSTYRVSATLSLEDGFTATPLCIQTGLPDPDYN